MSRRSLPIGVLVVASVAVGCAGLRLPPAEVVERARTAPTYSASLRVSLRGPSLRGGTRALLAFARPDAFRIEVPGPTGARMVAVARGGRLVAVFPAERAIWRGAATAAEMEALLGIALSPRELMDLLVGVPSPRLVSHEFRWGALVPRKIAATLPDGSRLQVSVDSAETANEIRAAAFDEPSSEGYRTVETEEARRLLGIRS